MQISFGLTGTFCVCFDFLTFWRLEWKWTNNHLIPLEKHLSMIPEEKQQWFISFRGQRRIIGLGHWLLFSFAYFAECIYPFFISPSKTIRSRCRGIGGGTTYFSQTFIMVQSNILRFVLNSWLYKVTVKNKDQITSNFDTYIWLKDELFL